MNLTAVLSEKIASLQPGDHLPGLQAVQAHIEAAFAHYGRAKMQPDDAAYTDAIYRTNHAFEGSVKEAYRVLTSSNPDNKTPHQIEVYLESQKVLRPRVLELLKNYRQEWRNPSTHDYKLDFDEGEALIAATTVATFAILMVDQIAAKLSSIAVKQVIPPKPEDQNQHHLAVGDRVSTILLEFPSVQWGNHRFDSESQLIGAVQGFIAFRAPDLKFENPIGSDLRISGDNGSVLVEIKRSQNWLGSRQQFINQLSVAMHDQHVEEGVLYIDDGVSKVAKRTVLQIPDDSKRYYVIMPIAPSHIT